MNNFLVNCVLFSCFAIVIMSGCSKDYYVHNVLKSNINRSYKDSISNAEYRQQLIDISDESFNNRQEIFNIFKKYGFNSKEADSANLNLLKLDSLLLMKFVLLENKYGWPLKNNLNSSKALNGAFIAVDHSTPEIIEKYLPKFKIAYKIGESYPLFYPTLKDRLLISKNKKQIYGTQSGGRELPDGTFEQYILPVKNFKRLDEIRVKAGLDSIMPDLKKGTLIFK